MRRFLLIIVLLMSSFAMMAQTHHWTPISGNQFNMSVFGVIMIDGVQQTATTLELGAFCGEECRASEFPMDAGDGNFVVPLSIRSNVASGETITFKLYDHLLTQELDLVCETTVTYDEQNDIIDPTNWFQFTFITPSWNNPNMWPGGVVPDQNSSVSLPDDIIIDNNAQVTVASLDTNGNTLTIDNGSTLTVTGTIVNDDPENFVIEDGAQVINESANVAAKAKKSITAYTAKDSNGWHLIASSVNDMPIAGSDFLTETYDLYRYNENTATWENYRSGHADFTTFEKGRGYLYANSNGISPAFVGTLNNSTVTYQVTANSSTASKGINIIGNPFPHNIYKGAGGAIDDSNLESGYYELTYAGAWVAHAFDDAIAPGQGVLVVAKSNGNVTIAKTNAEATAESASKSDVKRLKINVSGNGSEDRTYAYFSEGDGLDKLDNFSSSAAQISIKNGEKDYAIAHVGEECETMDVIFKNTKNADYTITIEGVEGFSYLHLIDNLTGADTDMLLEENYQFHATGNEYAERFKVVCRNNTGIGENAETAMFAYVNNGNIVVNGEGTLQLIDMTGRVIKTVEINGTQMIEKPSCGVYVLRMINGNEVKTQKIVVK